MEFKVFTRPCKAFVYLLVGLALSNIAATSLGWESYPASYNWSFGNYCYLNFNQGINFTTPPHKGIHYDSSLVGYWSMDGDAGSVVYDNSVNGNNGTATGTTIANGKYGAARYLDGNSYVTISDAPYLRFNLSDFTLSAVIKLDANGNGTYRTILRKGITGFNPFYGIRINPANRIEFILRDSPEPANSYALLSTMPVAVGEWVSISVTYNATAKLCRLYINGDFNSQLLAENIRDISSNKTFVIGKASDVPDQYFKGIIDDIRVYNCTLSANEVAALYTQPDPESLANYYSYKDSSSNNTLTIHVENLNANSNNVALVTCTNFFSGNRLVFQSNNSATMNVWTNLGKPLFTTGIWNSQNYTTTLTLDASSTAELNWNPATSPSASNLSATSTTAGNTTTFTALWRDNQSLSGGGYIFSTNNTGQWINASWTPFTTNPDWGNATLTLSSSVGAVVGFREYANNSMNLWGDSGIYNITTTAPTDTSTPTPTPTPSPTPTSQTNPFPTETILIAATAITATIAVLALAFKKGYIKIEIVEENPEENTDYAI